MKATSFIPTITLLAAACSALLLTGCASTTIFKDDFEADALGRPPALSPAGEPEGDAIDLSDPVVHGVAYVTNWPARSEKALHVFGAPSAITNLVRFISIPVTPNRDRKLIASWTGYWIGTFPPHSRVVAVLSGNRHELTRFNLEAGSVTARWAGGRASRTIAPLVGNREHVFLVSLDLTTGVVATTFSQTGVGTVSSSSASADIATAAGADHFELSIIIEQRDPDAPISYLVNDAVLAIDAR